MAVHRLGEFKEAAIPDCFESFGITEVQAGVLALGRIWDGDLRPKIGAGDESPGVAIALFIDFELPCAVQVKPIFPISVGTRIFRSGYGIVGNSVAFQAQDSTKYSEADNG